MDKNKLCLEAWTAGSQNYERSLHFVIAACPQSFLLKKIPDKRE